MDDLFASEGSSEQVIETLEQAGSGLDRYNLKLCKVNSNNPKVRAHFPDAKHLPPIVQFSPEAAMLDPGSEDEDSAEAVPSTALGLQWDTRKDTLRVKGSLRDKKFTKRGHLSHTMAQFDPDGIIAPAMLDAKLIQRDVCPPKKQDPYNLQGLGWDDPLPECINPEGENPHPKECKCLRRREDNTLRTIADLHLISIPRAVYPSGVPESHQLFAFADASEVAIAHVIYLRTVTTDGEVHVAFMAGSSRLTPRETSVNGELSIPRAELCAADVASQNVLQMEMDLKGEIVLLKTQFYTDSADVFAWINNRTDSFKKYVTRRRDRICQIADASQWHWIPGESNPADIGTRSISVEKLQESNWTTGPEFIRSKEIKIPGSEENATLETSEKFQLEIRKSKSLSTRREPVTVDDDIMDGSMWSRMMHESASPDPTTTLVRELQQQAFPEGFKSMYLANRNNMSPKQRTLMAMTPFMDEEGLCRSGGRLARANLTLGRKHPILIPEGIKGDALIGYIHAKKAVHQGRVITLAMLRDEGFVPLGGRRRIHGLIGRCVECRKLRAKPMQQKMADLPSQRLHQHPPFQYSGMDVFGPFKVNNGRVTRANTGTRKVWVLLFTCLYSRGVHLETLLSMDAPSFIMAFSRFEAIRGECLYLKCDAGSNFMGARNMEEQERQERDEMIEQIDSEWAKEWMREGKGKLWEVNPPKASHFGGVWERAIGSIRKVMDAMLLNLNNRLLSKEEFDTMLAKASSIVNSTPLWPIPDSPNEPQPLSPAMLLTQRDNPYPIPKGEFSKKILMDYGAARWKRVQYLADVFWNEWRTQYLYEIGGSREKWLFAEKNLQVGDLVLIKDKNQHRSNWPTGHITKVCKSADGLVRSATVKPHKRPDLTITERERDRPIVDLVLLREAPSETEPSPTHPTVSESDNEQPAQTCNFANLGKRSLKDVKYEVNWFIGYEYFR